MFNPANPPTTMNSHRLPEIDIGNAPHTEIEIETICSQDTMIAFWFEITGISCFKLFDFAAHV